MSASIASRCVEQTTRRQTAPRSGFLRTFIPTTFSTPTRGGHTTGQQGIWHSWLLSRTTVSPASISYSSPHSPCLCPSPKNNLLFIVANCQSCEILFEFTSTFATTLAVSAAYLTTKLAASGVMSLTQNTKLFTCPKMWPAEHNHWRADNAKYNVPLHDD